MGMFENDIAIMFADPLITVPVVYDAGGTATRGIQKTVDVLEQDTSGMWVSSTKNAVQVVKGTLGDVPADGSATITVDGVDYRVRDIRRDAPHFQNFVIA